MDLTGIHGAVEDINSKTVPEVLAGINQILDRLERIIDRLDGLSVVVVMGGKKPEGG